jgi:hypothetical protein
LSARKNDANTDLAAPALGVLHHNYTMTELVGEQLGPGGGMIIAAAPEKFDEHKGAEAVAVSQRAEQSPMRVVDVHDSATADLNNDGYVSLDEVVAMKRAGLSDQEIMNRLRATPQVFSLTPQQEHYLTDRGISHAIVDVINDLKNLNLPLPPSTQPGT